MHYNSYGMCRVAELLNLRCEYLAKIYMLALVILVYFVVDLTLFIE